MGVQICPSINPPTHSYRGGGFHDATFENPTKRRHSIETAEATKKKCVPSMKSSEIVRIILAFPIDRSRTASSSKSSCSRLVHFLSPSRLFVPTPLILAARELKRDGEVCRVIFNLTLPAAGFAGGKPVMYTIVPCSQVTFTPINDP